MSIEAMKQALEALEDVQDSYGNTSEWFKVRVDALRAAIEQAQEPVAWMTHSDDLLPLFHVTEVGAEAWGADPQPLYTAPSSRQWQGLTTDEVFECQEASYMDTYSNIEAKLKEKNG